ncbi:MAG: GDSL-type esterase/lipase family protein [Verrucomicrobiota bacterium]
MKKICLAFLALTLIGLAGPLSTASGSDPAVPGYVVDNFDSDTTTDWIPAHSNVISDVDINGTRLRVSGLGADDFAQSTRVHQRATFRNFIARAVFLDETDVPEIHGRVTDSLLGVRLSLDPSAGNRVRLLTGDGTEEKLSFLRSGPQPYGLEVRVWEDGVSVVQRTSKGAIRHVRFVKDDAFAAPAVSNVGLGSNREFADISSFECRELDRLTQVVVIGDSQSQLHVIGQPSYGVWPNKNHWVQVLEKYRDEPVIFIDSAQGGYTLKNLNDEIESRWTSLLLQDADHVAVIFAGINDFNRFGRGTVDVAWSRLQQLLDSVRPDAERILVCTLPPKANLTAKIVAFNDRIRQNAATLGYEVVDYFQLLADPNDDSAYADPNYLYKDGLHLALAAHEQMAPELEAVLRMPVAPASLTAEATAPGAVTLTWETSPYATGYRIQRQSAGGAWITLATVSGSGSEGTGSYTDNQLAPAQEYRYRVQAVNDVGASAFMVADPVGL